MTDDTPQRPRLLVIDDFYGRELVSGPNEDRANLCRLLGLKDVTTGTAKAPSQPIFLAEAHFIRGQTPSIAQPGDVVENDLSYCLNAVRSGWSEAVPGKPASWAMVLLDLCFYTGEVTVQSHARQPGMPVGRPGDDETSGYFGLRVLEALRREFPDLPVLILSSMPRADVARRISELGAVGFLARTDPKARELLRESLWRHGLFPDPSGVLLGRSRPWLLTLRHARRLASQEGNVLIRGERGSGKELFASFLHRSKNEKGRPFEVVNSAVFTPELFGSELFGIEPGTATGVAGKPGIIERADGGDLFLDEVADMPPVVQAGMLRVLQDRQVTRVGGRKTRKVKIRFLAASNADLERLAGEDRFREDLLDRLREAGTLVIPPLRERREDIPMMAEAFVREAEAANSKAMRRQLDRRAIDTLLEHDWPGNVRELRSVLFEAVNNHPDVEFLMHGHLRMTVRQTDPNPIESEAKVTGGLFIDAKGSPETLFRKIEEFEWDMRQPQVWAGCHPSLARAFAVCQAGLLKAALEATKRPTPANPQGEILIHPAVKLLTGNSTLTASKAADFIKRLLTLPDDIQQEILADPQLNEAYQIAKRLRPSQSILASQKARIPRNPS